MSRTLAVEERAGVVRLPMMQWRCPHCDRRLFDARLQLCPGEIISILCHGCRRVVTFTVGPQVDEQDYVT